MVHLLDPGIFGSTVKMKKLTDQQLENLLNDTESDLAERKESLRGDTPKKARQAVCAFANDLPNHNQAGVLFIGAKDDGSPSQEPITDELLRKLADMKTDGNILRLPEFATGPSAVLCTLRGKP